MNDLWWKITFDGKEPMMKGKIWWKSNFDRRPSLMEDNLWRKMTCDGRQPLMKDIIWWKMTPPKNKKISPPPKFFFDPPKKWLPSSTKNTLKTWPCWHCIKRLHYLALRFFFFSALRKTCWLNTWMVHILLQEYVHNIIFYFWQYYNFFMICKWFNVIFIKQYHFTDFEMGRHSVAGGFVQNSWQIWGLQ